MSTAIANVPPPAPLAQAAPRLGRPLISTESLVEEGQQRKLLMAYVDSHMRDGTDYGVIPGTGGKDAKGNETGKKALLKPGAEKLVDLFRCVPQYEVIEKVEDWERPLLHYLFRCRIITLDGGAVVAEGVGSCNSREKKYRYINADRKCPACGQAAIKKSKFPPRDYPDDPPGFYCFAKAGGCGANFDHDDPEITGQAAGKIDDPDVADKANTILKMAKKRALVDAAISLVRCSDMFTQDVEDFGEGESQAPAPARPAPRPDPPQQRHDFSRPAPGAKPAPAPKSPPTPVPDLNAADAADYEPLSDEIDAIISDPGPFKAAVQKSGLSWADLVDAVNASLDNPDDYYSPTATFSAYRTEDLWTMGRMVLVATARRKGRPTPQPA